MLIPFTGIALLWSALLANQLLQQLHLNMLLIFHALWCHLITYSSGKVNWFSKWEGNEEEAKLIRALVTNHIFFHLHEELHSIVNLFSSPSDYFGLFGTDSCLLIIFNVTPTLVNFIIKSTNNYLIRSFRWIRIETTKLQKSFKDVGSYLYVSC